MKIIKLLAIMLSFFIANASAVRAKDLSALELRQVCASTDKSDQLNCLSYIRAIGERLQVTSTYFDQPCRKQPISNNDWVKFKEFLQNETLAQNTSANAYTIKYWSQRADGVPCLESDGLWSAQELATMCKEDMSDKSPCKFYTLALLEFMNTLYTLQEKRFICLPENSTHLSDKKALKVFTSSLSENVQYRSKPASEQLPSSLQAKYPCKKGL